MALTVPCSDNGTEFIRSDRIDKISSVLDNSNYKLLGRDQLAYLYCHNEYSPEKPAIILSSHVDSLYGSYFSEIVGDELHGTMDNSASNGVLVELMKRNGLPPQALVAFTGDEENDSKGVDQVISITKNTHDIFANIGLVISLDLTERCFKKKSFTAENCFVGENKQLACCFDKKRDLKTFLEEILGKGTRFIGDKDAEQDESWQYDEYNLNCFTLCLPCRVLGEDMHDDEGVAVKIESFRRYSRALQALTLVVDKDLQGKNDN
nr:M28 family peptidase [uncultured Dethiosulfovibrio sp.]